MDLLYWEIILATLLEIPSISRENLTEVVKELSVVMVVLLTCLKKEGTRVVFVMLV